eukprot:scaffold175108_cov42-Prasinocladus_malaysianus.AAC.1
MYKWAHVWVVLPEPGSHQDVPQLGPRPLGRADGPALPPEAPHGRQARLGGGHHLRPPVAAALQGGAYRVPGQPLDVLQGEAALVQ